MKPAKTTAMLSPRDIPWPLSQVTKGSSAMAMNSAAPIETRTVERVTMDPPSEIATRAPTVAVKPQRNGCPRSTSSRGRGASIGNADGGSAGQGFGVCAAPGGPECEFVASISDMRAA